MGLVEEVYLGEVVSGPDVHYPEEALLAQLFSIESNLSFFVLSRKLLIQAFSCSSFYTYIKMDKVFHEGDLAPIGHKEFNEFIKGKGFKGQDNYKLRDLKAMFGFKPMITGSPVMISSDGMEPKRFNSMSKALTYTGIPYVTLQYAKKNSRNRVHSNGKEYAIIYHQLKCHTVISNGEPPSLT